MAETKPFMNDAGTVVITDQDTYVALYKPAGYRPLKAGEFVPLQQAEVSEDGGTAFDPVAAPDAKAVKAVRRAQAADDGANDG